MSTTFTIAHLSDLHFSSGAYVEGNHTHSIDQLKGIETVIRAHDLDMLVVTGDLSDRGDPEGLLRAYSWLFHKIDIGKGVQIGLEMSPDRVGLVPGNHDAFHNTSDRGPLRSVWQKGLFHFNTIFKDHQFNEEHDSCRYDWIQKGDRGVFVVYVDTCYIGDPLDEKIGRAPNALRAISKIARGKFNCNQSSQIMAWYERGMAGKLEHPSESMNFIDAGVFASSLKIVAAHHYLFEPVGSKREPLLRLYHSNAVFTDLASADIDIYLCGHKHEADISPTTYGEKLTLDGKSRHILNLFRRAVGVNMFPKQVRGEHGRLRSRALTLLYELSSVLQRRSTEKAHHLKGDSGAKFVQEVVEELKVALENPKKFEAKMLALLAEYGIKREDSLEVNELRHLQQHLDASFSHRDRVRLKEVAKRIEELARNLNSRPFVHIMTAAAAKRAKPLGKHRSFNIYRIDWECGEHKIVCNRYVWDQEQDAFLPPVTYPLLLQDWHKALLPRN